MLYVTTRNKADAYTAQRVLRDRRGPDGGLFLPFRCPVLPQEEILALGELKFNDRVAAIINLLFNTRLTGYHIDLAAGRYCVRLNRLNGRLLMAECWHNNRWTFSQMVDAIVDLIRVDKDSTACPGDWAAVGVRIAVLFGIFGEMIHSDMADMERKVDVSVLAGDFSAPMSAWYARKMGLPIGNIICCCNDNSGLWDLFCHGQLRTDGIAKDTLVPEGDVAVSIGIERLIYEFGGAEEVERYLDALRQGRSYYVDDRMLRQMRQGIYVTVNGDSRIRNTVANVWATFSCLMAPCAALCYAGLQDYRARTGEGKCALVMSENSPRAYSEEMTQLLNITHQELENRL